MLKAYRKSSRPYAESNGHVTDDVIVVNDDDDDNATRIIRRLPAC